jgi:hypothetical protein
MERRNLSAWSDGLSEWLKPFLAQLKEKARRRMYPLTGQHCGEVSA